MTSDEKVTYFAETDARNKRTKFGIKAKDRTRHVYVIGKTGMGKSTLLENMAVQDIQSGEGLCFIDPHGKTADLLLKYVPENRIKDVVYFAPFDVEFPISFNVMEDVGYEKRHLVVSGLMSTFKKIWLDAWSARMEYILSNTLLALLEYPGATLLGVNKMLSDKTFRKKVVDNITDPAVRSFWVDEFAKYTEKFAAEATPAIQNKIGQFTNNPLIRNIIGQPKSSFDIRKMMDERKILIVNLSKGRVGESNANLLGSMLITKIYLAAMSRADASETLMKKLPNFYLYVDEFQSFANESFADILSEARKYKLNLTIAHQYIEQMSEEVRAAVFGNVGTMMTFRVGSFDAELLEKEFTPRFTAEDIVNLGFAQIYLRLMIDGIGSQPFSARTLGPIAEPAVTYLKEVIESSRSTFGQLRSAVEEQVRLQTMGLTAEEDKAMKESAALRESASFQKPAPTNALVQSRRDQPQQHSQNHSQSSDTHNNSNRRDAHMAPRPSQSQSQAQFQTQPQQSARQPERQDRFAPPPDETGGFLDLKSLKKGVTPESKADLRSALAALVKPELKKEGAPAQSTPVPVPKPQSQPLPKIESKSEPKFEPKAPVKTESKKEHQDEVPEEVLRKLLAD